MTSDVVYAGVHKEKNTVLPNCNVYIFPVKIQPVEKYRRIDLQSRYNKSIMLVNKTVSLSEAVIYEHNIDTSKEYLCAFTEDERREAVIPLAINLACNEIPDENSWEESDKYNHAKNDVERKLEEEFGENWRQSLLALMVRNRTLAYLDPEHLSKHHTYYTWLEQVKSFPNCHVNGLILYNAPSVLIDLTDKTSLKEKDLSYRCLAEGLLELENSKYHDHPTLIKDFHIELHGITMDIYDLSVDHANPSTIQEYPPVYESQIPIALKENV